MPCAAHKTPSFSRLTGNLRDSGHLYTFLSADTRRNNPQTHKASSEEPQMGVTCARHGGSDSEYWGRAEPISEQNGGALAPRLAP